MTVFIWSRIHYSPTTINTKETFLQDVLLILKLLFHNCLKKLSLATTCTEGSNIQTPISKDLILYNISNSKSFFFTEHHVDFSILNPKYDDKYNTLCYHVDITMVNPCVFSKKQNIILFSCKKLTIKLILEYFHVINANCYHRHIG